MQKDKKHFLEIMITSTEHNMENDKDTILVFEENDTYTRALMSTCPSMNL